MADPISIAASVAGLLALADNLVQRTFKYVAAVRQSKTELSNLASELAKLCGVLKGVENVARELEGLPPDTISQSENFMDCKQTLEKLNAVLGKHNDLNEPDFSIGKLRSKLRWPFTKAETVDLIAEVQRHQQRIELALSADSITVMLHALSKQQETTTELEDLRNDIHDNIEAQASIQLSNDRKELLSSLCPVNPKVAQQLNLKSRHPGTCSWVLETIEFKNWMASTNAILWLYGIPGAGKSVAAASIIAKIEDVRTPSRPLAYFYCDYKSANTKILSTILCSLIAQICAQNKPSLAAVEKFAENCGHSTKSIISSNPEELLNLIFTIAQFFESVAVVVDGLDECGDSMGEVVELLSKLGRSGSNIRALYLSQDLPEIKNAFEQDPKVLIAAQPGDIRLYVLAEIERRTKRRSLRLKDPTLEAVIIETLVSRSGGMFRWVECQLDYLGDLPNDLERRKALTSLPIGLNATYERIIHTILKGPPTVTTLVRRILRWIIHPFEPLSVSELCEAVSIEPGDTFLDPYAIIDEEDILRCCRSLVRKSQTRDVIELAHFSVRQFMLSIGQESAFAVMGIHEADSHLEMAKTCLTYLSLENFEMDADASFSVDRTSLARHSAMWKEFPFRRHASTFWDEYAKQNMEDEELKKLVNQIFDRNRASNLLLSMKDSLIYSMEEYNSPDLALAPLEPRVLAGKEQALSLFSTPRPLHYACILGLPDLCNSLLETNYRNDIHVKSSFGTPIHCAILGKCVYLTVRGYDAKEVRGIMATSSGVSLEILKVLLSHGASPTGRFHYHKLQRKITDLHLAMMIDTSLAACLLRYGAEFDLDTLGLLDAQLAFMDKSTVLLDSISRVCLPGTLIHVYADILCRHGHHESISKVLKPEEIASDLVTAVEENSKVDVLAILALPGKNLLASRDSDGQPLLHIASSLGSADIVRILVENGYDPMLRNADGETPLYCAVKKQAENVVQVLLGVGCDPLTSINDRDSPWHLSASLDNLQIVVDLFSRLPLNAVDPERSLRSGTTTTAQNLPTQHQQNPTEAMIDIDDHADSEGCTALHRAVISGTLEIIEWLLSHGAKPSKCTKAGSSALHLAISNSRPDKLSVVKRLVDFHPDVNLADSNGVTALHLAVLSSQLNTLSIVDVLLNHNADPNSIDSKGASVLEYFRASCVRFSLPSWYPAINLLGKIKAPPVYETVEEKMPKEDTSNSWTADLGDMKFLTLYNLIENGADVLNIDQSSPSIIQILVEFASEIVQKPEGIAQESGPMYRDILSMVCKVLSKRSKISCTKENMLACTYQNLSLLNISLRARHNTLTRVLLTYPVDVEMRDTTTERFNALETAIKFGCDIEIFKTLLSKISTASETSDSKLSLLHMAARNRTYGLEFSKELVKNGCDVNARDALDQTPLTQAVTSGNPVLVSFLLSQGADTSLPFFNAWNIGYFANTMGQAELVGAMAHLSIGWASNSPFDCPLCVLPARVTMMHWAAHCDDVDMIGVLLAKGLFRDVNCENHIGETPLHIACAGGNILSASFLLSKGANPNTLNRFGATPLHYAAYHGREDAVHLMLQYDCKIDVEDHAGFTPGLYALGQNFPKAAAILGLKYQDSNQSACQSEMQRRSVANTGQIQPVTVRTDTRATPWSSKAILEALQTRNTQFLGLVIQLVGVLPAVHSDKCRCGPLILALLSNHVESTYYVMKNCSNLGGIACSDTGFQGYTPLHFAMRFGDNDLLQYLLQSIPESHTWNVAPVSALHIAVANGQIPSIKIFLGFLKDLSTSHDSNTTSEAHSVISDRKEAVGGLLERYLNSVMELAEWEWVLTKDDNLPKGLNLRKTPLHVAVMESNTEAVRILLEMGAKADVYDHDLWTPLHHAAESDQMPILDLLVQHGANVNARTDFLETPLILAAVKEKFANVDFLIVHGADRNLRDCEGRSYLHYIPRGRKDKLLESKEMMLVQDASGVSPLEIHIETFSYEDLFEEGSIPKEFWSQKSDIGGTILLCRSIISRIDCLKKIYDILGPEATQDSLNHRSILHQTPLYKAARMDKHEVISLFLDWGADIDLHAGPEGSALMVAAAAGRLNSVKVLVQRGASTLYRIDNATFSATEKAAYHPEVLKYLHEVENLDAGTDEGPFIHETSQLRIPSSGILYGTRSSAAM